MRDDLHKRRDDATIDRWLQTQRGKRQYKAAPPAAKAVARIMRPLSGKFGAGSTGLAAHWPEIIGARLAKISKPLKFAGGREGRTLLISAPGPAAALITASSGSIINKVNTYLGPDYVRHIKVIQTRMKTEPQTKPTPRGLSPQEADRLHSGLESVADPALKDALEALGRKVLTKPEK